MAKKKQVLKVKVTGTGLNEEFYCASHDIVSYPSSTYHKFTFVNGVVVWKNDFGVSQVIVSTEDMPEGMEY